MVDFDENMSPAHMHGFFQYNSSVFPTNVLHGDGKSIEDIEHQRNMTTACLLLFMQQRNTSTTQN